jgi:hypothetical protein
LLVAVEVLLQEVHIPMAVVEVAALALETVQHMQTALVVVELLLPVVQLRLQQHSAQLHLLLVVHSKVDPALDIQLLLTKVVVAVVVDSTVVAVDTATVRNQTAAAVVDPVTSTRPV